VEERDVSAGEEQMITVSSGKSFLRLRGGTSWSRGIPGLLKKREKQRLPSLGDRKKRWSSIGLERLASKKRESGLAVKSSSKGGLKEKW